MYEEDDYAPEPPDGTLEVPVTVSIEWSNQEITQKTVEALTAKLYDELRESVHLAVRNRLDDVVNGLILEVMDKEIQRTNSWGKPIADKASITELLQRDVESWLSDKVDPYGRSDKGAYSQKQTRAQYLFKESTSETLESSVKKIIAENVGDLEDIVAEVVKQQISALAKRK